MSQNFFHHAAMPGQTAVRPSEYRHPKENFYFLLAAVLGIIVWIAILAFMILSVLGLVYLVLFAIFFFFTLFTLKAYFFGNALRVDGSHCPEIYAEVQKAAAGLGLQKIPYIFVVNGHGTFNALALRFVGPGYVVLMSNLVDHYLRDKRSKELTFIIAHELAHHAAGHTALWKVLLTMPGTWIPFLGKAYGRACEYTCDRAGALVVNDPIAATRSLLSLVHGSDALCDTVNVERFLEQEQHVPGVFRFLLEISSSHPRLTRRVKGVRDFLANRASRPSL